jgi:integral membrane sensor domain MASE1
VDPTKSECRPVLMMLLTHPDNQMLQLQSRRYGIFVLAFTLYFIAALYCIYVSRQPGSIAAIWYANAIMVMFLQAFAYRDWYVLLILAALANLSANLILKDSINTSLTFIPGNLLEIALIAYCLRRFIPLRQCIENPLSLLKLFALILLPIAVSACVAALTVSLFGSVPYEQAWLLLFTGSVVGAVSIFPLGILLLCYGWQNVIQINQSFTFLMCILLALLIALFGFIYLPDPYIYISATLILVAFIGRFSGTALAVLVYSIIISTLIAMGVFQSSIQGQYMQSDAYLYLPLVMTLLQPLLLAAAMQRIQNLKLW